MIKGKVLTILAALLGVTAACSLGVAAYIIIQPGTSPENGVAETEAQLAGVEIVDHTGEEEHIDNDALPDISVDDGAVWTDSSNPESVPEPEPATSVSEPEPEPESVISEPEPEYQNPGTHGGYLYEVDGARFYTEHDLSQWLRPNEKYPQHLDFDIGQMIFDLYGGNMVGNNAYVYKLGEIAFDDPDKNNNNLYHTVRIIIRPDNESSEFWCQEIKMCDCPGPYTTNCYSILEDYCYLVHKDMAPIILYSFEQMLRDPQYDAVGALNLNENFDCGHYYGN